MRVNNRSLFKPRAKGTYRIENKSDETTVYLYDEISWFGISAEKFVKDLDAITSKTIHLRVNSPGGLVFDGTTIYNAIRQHKSTVIAHIDGLAASIASIIVMAADEIRMGDNAFLMIHEPYSMVVGNADMMREEANLLDKVGGVIAKTYMDKTGKDEDEILDLMANETWFTAQEALDAGFIDFIDSEKNTKAVTNLFDLSAFLNVPDRLKDEKPIPTKRDLERLLRDALGSEKQAKAILAEGYQAVFRDGEPVDDVKPTIAKVETQREVEAPKPAKKTVHSLMDRLEAATL